MPIELFIKKPSKSFNNCLFIDPERKYNWNDEGCKAFDLGEYLQCSCNHLTDFSIAKYNPVRLIEDMMNVLSEAWIINDFKLFQDLLSLKNAITVYIFFGILFVYFVGLVFTVSYDRKDSYDNFVYEGEKENENKGCCDKEQVMESIMEVKHVADQAEEERLKNNLKHLDAKLSKNKLYAILGKTLNLADLWPESQRKSDQSRAADNSNSNIGKGKIKLFTKKISVIKKMVNSLIYICK